MTIKDMEELSGMTRANIRFYEAQGLLTPARGENGYRNYSIEDLAVLKRIKLLRTLRISLEEIKALHQGEEKLVTVLDRHIGALNQEREDIDRSQRVCREICTDGASYQTLDAQRYLDSLSRIQEERVLSADVIPTVQAPFRRWFARFLDGVFYLTLWDIFLKLVFHNGNFLGSGAALTSILLLVFPLVLEPVLLNRFGTTPGKWVLGLHVTDPDGQRISYFAAFRRTWNVLLWGTGLRLPIFDLIRLYLSYKTCIEGETQPWEYESNLALRQRKRWKTVLLVVAYIAVLMCGIPILTRAVAERPHHQGGITTAEFCDNFNRFAEYYGMEYGVSLDKTGKWVKDDGDLYSIDVLPEATLPDFVITETDGEVTGVSFQFETSDPKVWVPNPQNQIVLTALSFGCTQKNFGFFSDARKEMLEMIDAEPFEDFHFSENGITMDYNVEYSGYNYFSVTPGYLCPIEGEPVSCSFSFRITKDE